MVELRKRKPSQVPAAPPPPAKKKANPVKAAVDKAKAAFHGEKTNGEATSTKTKIAPGETIPLDSFGGEVETNEGTKTSLKKLVDESKSGVVLFTYPKASTPGCTTQACLFRDAYTHLTATGLSIYGLSNDSTKSNTTFKTKQNLPYPLLCDPSGTLISAIGLKKAPKGTTRGVFVIDKSGKILAAEPGGPQATVDVVANLIKEGKAGTADGGDNAATASAAQTVAAEAPATEKEDTSALSSAAVAPASESAAKPEESTNSTVAPATVPDSSTTNKNSNFVPDAAPATNATDTTDTPMTDAPTSTANGTTEPSSSTLAPPTASSAEAPKMDEAPLITTPSKDEEDAAQTASEVADSAKTLDKSDAVTPAATGSAIDGAGGLSHAAEEHVPAV